MTTQSTEPLDLDWLAIAGNGVDGITDEQRRAVADALRSVAELLGESVLRDALTWKHPRLGMLIGNKAPWTRPAIVEFARELRAVQHAANLRSLLDRLRDPTPSSFYEARSVLHVASEMASAGSSLVIEPEVLVVRKKAKPKKPDFSLRHPSMAAEGYVEVSQILDSLVTRRGLESMDKLTIEFMRRAPQEVVDAGVVHRVLSAATTESILAKMIDAARRAVASGELVVLEIPGTIEFGVAPKSKEEALNQWGKERGVGANSWLCPPNDMDDPDRVCGKIREKIQQLPTDRPGMIAISGMSCSWLRRDAAEELLVMVAEETYHWPNLAAVVVGFGAWARHGATGEAVGDSFLLGRQDGDGSTTRSIVTLNPYCKVGDAESFRALVRAAFVNAVRDTTTGATDFS
jgi:hypothetical protein